MGIGVIGKYFGEKRFEIVSMGTFAMISSLWILTETPMFSILTGAPIAVHFVDYISLSLLGLPGLLFAAYATSHRSKLVITIGSILTFSNLGYQVYSTLSGGKDYHQLLWLTHVELAMVGALILYLLVRSIILKTLSRSQAVILVISLTAAVAAGIADIIRYLTYPAQYTVTSFFKYSIFLFIILSGIYEFFNISEMSRRGRYAEIMEKLAYNDGLTGLTNRTGFNKAIEELRGADYSIVSLLGTQVVSGANYEYICKKTVVIPDAKPILCFMTVYKDLDGNAMITNISDLRLGTFYGAESAEDEKPTEKLAGGWSIPEAVQAVNLPEPVAGIYDKVMEEKEGYLPVAYLGSQLVNGTNHAVLCFNESSPCIVYIYAPLSGDPELVNIYNIDMAEASGN